MSRRSVLALALLLSGGCGGKVPPTTVWSLPIPREQAEGVVAGAPALGIGRFTADAELRTTQLTWREGEGRRLNRYPYHEWADYPDRMLHGRLVAELISSRNFSAVTTAPPGRGLDGVLTGRLVEFDEWDDAQGVTVRVGLQWSLMDGGGRLLAAELTRAETRASKSVEAVVAAFDEATATLVRELSDRIAQVLASRDEPARPR